MGQIHIAPHTAQHNQRPEKESQSEKKITRYSVVFLINEYHADEESRKHNCGQVKIISQRHDPRRECRADVGTHDD